MSVPSYEAVVCKIRVRPHPNADRIQLGTCMGNQVVVGLDTEDGQMGVYFRSDGQLSPEFMNQNNLVRKVDPNTGKNVGGFFEINGRVRAQKFRGEISDGFWCPLSFFWYTMALPDSWQEGYSFASLGRYAICQKYETPATKAARRRGEKPTERETPMFHMMKTVHQFRKDVDGIPNGSWVTVTEKLHGTSHRIGRVLVPETEGTLVRFVHKLLGTPDRQTWSDVSGSRRVILGEPKRARFDTSQQRSFRDGAIQPFLNNLHPGEVVYLEIVGYTETGALIMSAQDLNNLKDRKLKQRLKKQYGRKIAYTYGCATRTCQPYVYRIVQMSVDGTETELSWAQVKRRCGELGVKHVPEMQRTQIVVENAPEFDPRTYHDVTDKTMLRAWVELRVNGSSLLSDQHPREGVVVRVDTPGGVTTWLKHKPWLFGVLEGYLKEQDSYVDLEEAS